MQRFFVILIFISSAFYPAYAFKSCDVEKVVTSFFSDLAKCENDAEVSIESIVNSSDTGTDYSQMKPAILPDDIEVKVEVKLCDIKDRYFVWLRKNKSSYDVITYTSFSQPD